ncbi:MAG: L,D-transpeptidase [Celeribacter sp.]|jgi:lipoprotein-anchoring transpeptidase ErfK/SrfK
MLVKSLNRRTFMTGTAAAAAAAVATPALSHSAPQQFQVPEQFKAQVVRVNKDLPAGQIFIKMPTYHLYYTLGDGTAVRYGVALGKEGLKFRGTATVERKVEWPSWTPTQDMIARDPTYAKYENGMPGGPTNPLGARALYLYDANGRDTLFRIHGTTDPSSIGKSVSNGCIRMYNSHVKDLYDRVQLGTRVTATG